MQSLRQPIAERTWCVIPVRNNGRTVRDVALACRREVPHVVVVDDGSTDADLEALMAGTDIAVLRHERNLGKGRAILSGLRHVVQQGGEFMITIDGDGQHDPADIRRFLPVLDENPTAIVIGARRMEEGGAPLASKFGMRVSDFWLDLETGLTLRDTQSGFRAYPVRYLSRIRCSGSRYEFEVEVLARAAWAGLAFKTVDVAVKYPAGPEGVSHFHPLRDNVRISLMHARLVGRRLVPWPHRRLVRRRAEWHKELFRHPARFMKRLLREHSSPRELGASAGVGVFIATLPIMPFHTVTILYVTTRLNVNRLLGVVTQNICTPPFVPLVCIELGYFMRFGRWLTEMNMTTLWRQAPERLYEWFLGSLIVAPVLAVITGVLTAGVVAIAKRRWEARKALSKSSSPGVSNDGPATR